MTTSWTRRSKQRIEYAVEPIGGDGIRVMSQTGRSFLIDRTDWIRLGSPRVQIRSNRTVSAYTVCGTIKISRLILGATPAQLVDHVNGDPSDNRRTNLRLCSGAQNAQNKAIPGHNTSGFKGVCQSGNQRKPFRAYGYSERRQVHLGLFIAAEEAARAYDAFARESFGTFACVNFPIEGEQSVHRRGAQ